MRLHLRLTGNTQPVPFDHLHQLTGALHKWLGENTLHDGLSLYSFSWLKGAVPRNGYLTFPKGTTWCVSFSDETAAKKLLSGIMLQPEVAYGMRVYEVQEQATPTFGGTCRFLVDGPVIARRTLRYFTACI